MKPSVRASFVGLFALLFLLVLAPGSAAAVTPAAQNGLRIDWHQAQSSGLGKPEFFPASAYANGTYVVSEDVPSGGRILASSDARNWSVVWSGNRTPGPIVVGGPGFVAWESGVLLSKNGRKWTRANAAVPQKLLNSDFVQLGSVGGVVVAFPGKGHGFWSSDGRNWHAITGGPEKPITTAGDGTHLWAFTGGRDFGTGTRTPVKVWMTQDGMTWTSAGQLPQSTGVSGLASAFGPLGGVAIAGSRAWFSADDLHWHLATNTPTITSKGRAEVDAVVADSSGFILTGHRDPPGCVVDPVQRRALTWTSVDGKVWRQMPAKGWLSREIDQLFITGRTLFGIGIHWTESSESGVVWRAPLPNVATDNAPPPPPVTPPSNQGC